MRKKNTFFIGAAIFCLAICGVSIYAAAGGYRYLLKNVADGEEGKITFKNNGTNVTETFLIEEESVNYYTETIGGRLYGGTPLYAKASHCLTLGSGNDYIARMFDSTVSFVDDLGTEFKFQNLSYISVYFDSACDVTVSTSIDGESFSDNYATTDDNGYLCYSITGSRYVRFSTGGSMEFPLSKIVLDYSCSYDYVEPETKTVTIYASNDIHGMIEPTGSYSGLKAWGTYGKQKGQEANTLLLDQGDTWQGSLYSNMNRGNLIQDIMCYMEYDARTVGNHDFDWGVNALKTNTARTFTTGGKTYSIPTLAANVYDYNFSTKTFGNTQQSDIGGKTVSYTLENGLKVGVVGVIGSDQITSINSLYTQTIGFKDHIQTIKDEATNLRNAGCDIVICSIHAGIQKELEHSSQYLTNKGLGDYVDLLLGAHTHKEESYVDSENPNVHMYQFESNTTMFGKITLSYDTAQKKVINTSMETLSASYIKAQVGSDYDPVIANLIDTNKTSCDVTGSEVLASNVINLPPVNYGVDYVIDSYDTAIYKLQAGAWVKNTQVVPTPNPEAPNWFFEYGIDQSDCINGYYYIDISSENGTYYLYSNNALVELGSVTEGDSSKNWAPANLHNVSFDKSERGPNVMARAVLETALDEGFNDVCFSYVNPSRAVLSGSQWTWADIYEAFPFDNAVYIIEVTGQEILDEVVRYNNVYFNPSFSKQIDLNTKYKIACLDYLAFHTGSDRYYDYFPENNGNYVDCLSKNYREILRDWLKDNHYDTGKCLSRGDFASSLSAFNRNSFIVTTQYNVTYYKNDGTSDVHYSGSLVYGTSINTVGTPIRSGYSFAGWYYDAECTQPASSTITANATYYAKWVDKGSYDNPLTVADAIEMAQGHDSNNKTSAMYCRGIVSRQGNQIGTAGDIRYVYIRDEDYNEIQIYYLRRCYGASTTKGNNFTSINDLQIGDELLIRGQLYCYNDTPQFASGTYCVEINGEDMSQYIK